MPFIVLANFKSHKTSTEVETWIRTVTPVAESAQDQATVLVAPSLIHLPFAVSELKPPSAISLCAQDVSPFPPGAYTGAVNAAQLHELGVSYSLVGHSERRRYFHETHQDIANKIKELLSHDITPVVCLSREDIVPQFAALDDNLQARCLYCFEPPADIGGTTTAPLDHILDTVKMIKQYGDYPVLYGGSVTPDNFASLLTLPLSGVLVATASLDPQHIISLIGTLAHAR